MSSVYLTEEEARALYVQGDAAHDFDHVLRVTRLAEQIARAEGADVTVVRLAALLHDVPVVDDGPADARLAHHLRAARFAGDFLAARGLGTGQVRQVVHAIEAHRFRDQTRQPETLEAQCLYDADKLDSIGAIGVGRAFAFAGAHGARLWTEPWTQAPDFPRRPQGADYTPVHEFVYKLRAVLDTLHTETARRMGARRHAFMVAFFDQLDAEMAETGWPVAADGNGS
ncbi:HD domain-containing protein [Litorilinea aerophila]|uniref:HD domain-containing protein n=1 Tax=Litorilinea aerophila TaxID=1204385 RepID=A0A540VHA5_9CHLR|nr:HD domain-containing protein [Litorilinea aerophila]MCC9076190.1 HD domain-containing protein [Litorilinea aerophila]